MIFRPCNCVVWDPEDPLIQPPDKMSPPWKFCRIQMESFKTVGVEIDGRMTTPTPIQSAIIYDENM